MNKKPYTILVSASPTYLVSQSDPSSEKFVWSYEVSITNQSEEILQLLSRCWRITDMTGKIEEIRGPGVIGLQPIIKAGKSFTYTSFCQLMTPQGAMEGHYELQNLDEEKFNIEIPKFVLCAPAGITKGYRSKLH